MQAKLQIEFFLPCDLFDEEVDNWKTPDRLPLGIQYPVTIRALDRLKTTNEWNWQDKCCMISNNVRNIEERSIHWISNPIEKHKDKMHEQLYSYLAEKHIICCCVAEPSLASNRQIKRDWYHAIVASGTPIALWPRKFPASSEKIALIREEMQRLLLSHNLFQLPEMILHYRRKARQLNIEDHLGHHLTFFWDFDIPKGLRQRESNYKNRSNRK